jgi:predicted small lipoprotein YifL
MMRWIRPLCALAAVALLAACGTKPVYDPPEKVAQRAYVHDGPPKLTLITMVNNRSGAGAHSSLMINASQRVMYDPAGRYHNSTIPEQNDLLYGITPDNLQRYVSFHARDTHHVVIQEVEVNPAVAEQAFALAKAQGTSWDAMCSTNVSRILSRVQGFEGLNGSIFPARLMKSFGELPGVKTEKVYEYDKGKG